MTGNELRQKFLDFFSKRGHVIVPSNSLISDDPSVLLTTAGMQQFKKYYKDPSLAMTPSVASVQKCFRTSDIDEVGDDSHLTFFEMLGNFSFGGYFKEDAIKYAREFLENIGLKIDYVTVFSGEGDIDPDRESKEIWLKLGIQDIRRAGREDNFWGPTGTEGPCGPTTEIYIRGIEVWNIVFNEYYCRKLEVGGEKLEKLKTSGVDTGMGLERLAAVVQGKKTVFETDFFSSYVHLLSSMLEERKKRIVLDHLRGSIFLIGDGVRPSNKDRGYVLRRLMRKIFIYEHKGGLSPDTIGAIVLAMIRDYGAFYPELLHGGNAIPVVVEEERARFFGTLKRGLKELERVSVMTGKIAFDLYQSYGIPPEITQELRPFDREEFENAKRAHGEISQQGAEKKFGGHGLMLNTDELKAANEEELKKVTRLHTATHLLHAALRRVLGKSVQQMGSDITTERTRFDFSFDRKLTDDEKKQIENLVNDVIDEGHDVTMREMPYPEAIEQGALHFFKEKYPDRVKVYTIEDFSSELCDGPHVQNTKDIGRFRILKEEAVASGVRRIRATVE